MFLCLLREFLLLSLDSTFVSMCLFMCWTTLALFMGRSLKKARLVETLDTTSIFSGTVLSREWSKDLDLSLLDNEITREMHDKDSSILSYFI